MKKHIARENQYQIENGICIVAAGVTIIHQYFIQEEDKSSIKSIVIPHSLEEIDEYAFDNCTELTNIEIPNSVTHIGAHAFSDCIL